MWDAVVAVYLEQQATTFAVFVNYSSYVEVGRCLLVGDPYLTYRAKDVHLDRARTIVWRRRDKKLSP